MRPSLLTKASAHIATSYAELRDTSANAKSGGGTLPITARTLETMIRLSTAHAKMKLRNEVLKTDVEAALKVLNFAIYHKELTDMDEREKEREMEMKRKADHDATNDGNADDGGSTADAMEVDGNPTTDEEDNSPERVQTFETILGQHVVANHLDQISIDEIEQLINRESAVPYTRQQVTSILERMQDSNRIMISDGIVRII